MLGVFLDTLVICTATAAIIIMAGPDLMAGEENNGIQLTQMALSSHVGQWGGMFVAVAILLFAFTSVIANYSLGGLWGKWQPATCRGWKTMPVTGIFWGGRV